MIKILYYWRSFPTTKRVELVGKKECAAAALDLEHKIFVVHETSLDSPINDQKNNLHPFYKAQIAVLVVNEALTSIFTEYFNFTNVFSLELALKLLENTEINVHAIELVDDWQPAYKFIYSLGPVELKTLKIYIETNLTNSFIRYFKS